MKKHKRIWVVEIEDKFGSVFYEYYNSKIVAKKCVNCYHGSSTCVATMYEYALVEKILDK
jgi:hypothetical protein